MNNVHIKISDLIPNLTDYNIINVAERFWLFLYIKSKTQVDKK